MDEELQLLIDWAKAREKFVAAKAEAARDSAAYRHAKKAMSELRTYWRQIRDALTAEAGEARPAPVEATAVTQ